jgi:hypothetical protein
VHPITVKPLQTFYDLNIKRNSNEKLLGLHSFLVMSFQPQMLKSSSLSSWNYKNDQVNKLLKWVLAMPVVELEEVEPRQKTVS